MIHKFLMSQSGIKLTNKTEKNDLSVNIVYQNISRHYSIYTINYLFYVLNEF